MKKISLKTVKNSMKRDEMRNVKGGSGGQNCYCWSFQCAWKGVSMDCNGYAWNCCNR